jgi:hypothetical protein
MPGVITTTRTATNVTAKTLVFRVTGQAPAGAAISATPQLFAVAPGRQVTLRITISAPGVADGQYFGRIDLNQVGGPRALHLPVAFDKRQGDVTLSQNCAPSSISVLTGRSTCSVIVHNNSLSAADVRSDSTTTLGLLVTGATGATRVDAHHVTAATTLAGRQPDAPHIAPGPTPAGYLPLDLFGVTPIPIGDEQAVNFDIGPYVFAGQTYNRIGVTSDGYLVAGGASDEDVQPTPQTLPNPARPNNVLAPFWTDLDGTGAPGVLAATLTDGVSSWLVIEWRVNVFGTTSLRVFQAWIGLNGSEDISFTYDPANLPAAPPAGYGLTVGAENSEGTAGDQTAPTMPGTAPTQDLRVSSTPGAPGGSLTYSFDVRGLFSGSVRTDMTTPLVRGTTTEVDQIAVTK